ncbi:HAD family acid phosphatase [Amycolatopsis sp. NPDC059027]|uniref:HAD family acid phosphatase n=1 Tax=Amycolatopsis sp. NPDC059027 TaxID=3346709 RepID=UPI00366C79B4
MKRVRTPLVATLAVAGLLATPATSSAAPTTAQAGLPPYATWIADVTAVTDQAASYLTQRLPGSGRPAIVLDIDNTSLESTYHPSLADVPALAPTLRVTRLAGERGATVFFVTGRPKLGDAVTRHNLDEAGYRYAGLYQTDLPDLLDLQKFKTTARADIEAKGYTIVANIGNSASDLAGGHSERTFKLPDYDGELP